MSSMVRHALRQPGAITATSGTSNIITITAVSGAASYNYYRDGSLLVNTSALVYDDTGGGAHDYQYAVVDSAGHVGPKSATASTQTTGPRVGVYWRVTGETISPSVNMEKADWSNQTPFDSAVDGWRPSHIGQSEYAGVPANVRALTHFEVVSGTSGEFTPLGTDTKYFRGTLYPKWTNSPTQTNLYSPAVNYSPLASIDKPRVNLINSAAATAGHAASVNRFHYRKDGWISLGVFIPSDYVEDTDQARESVLHFHGTGGATNTNWALGLLGSGSGATWTVDRYISTLANPNESLLSPSFSTPVTTAMKGKWVIHTFFFNMDNRTVGNGGTPKFKWWMNIAGQPATLLVNDSTTPYGFEEGTATPGWWIEFNLSYKGSWHGATGAGYSGNKNAPLVLGMSSVRIGDQTSSYSDVHPTQDSPP